MKTLTFITVIFFISLNINGQALKLETGALEAVGVTMTAQKLNGKAVVKVTKDTAIKEFDEPTFVKLKNVDFKDGTIEVNVLSKLLPNAPEFARGFIGIAFRVNEDNSKFECIYIRPTNARANDQVRRNHSIQYFAYPDYKFDRLRKESPEKYESYSNMGLNEWIKIKIVVKGTEARLYLNDSWEPALIVDDLKLGANQSGGIGLFVDVGTEGYFTDLKL